MLNIDSLLKNIYESLGSALRDGVSMRSLFEFLKKIPQNFTSKEEKENMLCRHQSSLQMKRNV